MIKTDIQSLLAKEVDEGLSKYPKLLSSKFFYDDEGDKIFQKIMAMPSYYVTKAEYELLEEQSKNILSRLRINKRLNIYELGAGDGTKTIILLNALEELGIPYTYYPIDISADVLATCKNRIESSCLKAEVVPINATYDDAVEAFSFEKNETNLVLFLGSNLGNLLHADAIVFLRKIQEKLSANDYFMMGLDKMKDPAVILEAYNDKEGITRDFNLNLLVRINRELGGNFDITKFAHWPVYNPESGTCLSYLVSLEDQTVYIEALNKTIQFEKHETIHTEISQKYNQTIIEWLCSMSGLSLEEVYTDTNELFLECLTIKNHESNLEQ